MNATDTWTRIDAWISRRFASDRGQLDLAFAESLRVIAAAASSGATLRQAMERAADRGQGRIARACGRAAARMQLGSPIDVEVELLAEEIGTDAARLFAQVVVAQHRRGGDLGAPCRRLAALLHDRVRLDAEARAATAQARFSARAVIGIPVVLVGLAVLRSPDGIERALRHPVVFALAAPGILLIVIGAVVARRIARSAADSGRSNAVRTSGDRARLLVGSLAGDGPRSKRSARLAACAAVLSIPAFAAQGVSVFTASMAVAAIGAAIAWPWSDARRVQRHAQQVAEAGVEGLLEVSIALFAAGATAHEVATTAPTVVVEPLRSALAPAVHRVQLGRSIASAFAAVPAVTHSPQVDGWLHAVCTSAELGVPANDVLEQLLRDARAARRERLRSRAQTAGPRMQLALVLLVVPGVMWLMLLGTLGGLVEQLRSAGVA